MPSAVRICFFLAVASVTSCKRSGNPVSEDATPGVNLQAYDDEADADPRNPLAATQSRIEDTMDSVRGADLDDTWVRLMLVHESGAIALSRIALAKTSNASVRQLAARTIREASSSITMLTPLKRIGLFSDKAAPGLFAPTIQATFSNMTVNPGETAAATWGKKMLAYERGAVRLVDDVLTRAKSEKVQSVAKVIAARVADSADRFGRPQL